MSSSELHWRSPVTPGSSCEVASVGVNGDPITLVAACRPSKDLMSAAGQTETDEDPQTVAVTLPGHCSTPAPGWPVDTLPTLSSESSASPSPIAGCAPRKCYSQPYSSTLAKSTARQCLLRHFDLDCSFSSPDDCSTHSEPLPLAPGSWCCQSNYSLGTSFTSTSCSSLDSMMLALPSTSPNSNSSSGSSDWSPDQPSDRQSPVPYNWSSSSLSSEDTSDSSCPAGVYDMGYQNWFTSSNSFASSESDTSYASSGVGLGDGSFFNDFQHQ